MSMYIPISPGKIKTWWYDVNVFFQNERLKDLRFYGDMKRYSDIREILAYLEKSSDVRFQVNGRTLIVCEK